MSNPDSTSSDGRFYIPDRREDRRREDHLSLKRKRSDGPDLTMHRHSPRRRIVAPPPSTEKAHDDDLLRKRNDGISLRTNWAREICSANQQTGIHCETIFHRQFRCCGTILSPPKGYENISCADFTCSRCCRVFEVKGYSQGKQKGLRIKPRVGRLICSGKLTDFDFVLVEAVKSGLSSFDIISVAAVKRYLLKHFTSATGSDGRIGIHISSFGVTATKTKYGQEYRHRGYGTGS